MKIFKLSLLFLALSIVLNLSTVFAGKVSSTGIVGIFAELGVGKTFSTETWTKGNDFNIQSYQFQKAITTITNPCPKCNFKVTLYKGKNTQIGSITGKTGNNYYFDNKLNQTSSAAGDYHISIKRADVTAVTSWTTGDWYIAKNNNLAKYKG